MDFSPSQSRGKNKVLPAKLRITMNEAEEPNLLTHTNCVHPLLSSSASSADSGGRSLIQGINSNQTDK